MKIHFINHHTKANDSFSAFYPNSFHVFSEVYMFVFLYGVLYNDLDVNNCCAAKHFTFDIAGCSCGFGVQSITVKDATWGLV